MLSCCRCDAMMVVSRSLAEDWKKCRRATRWKKCLALSWSRHCWMEGYHWRQRMKRSVTQPETAAGARLSLSGAMKTVQHRLMLQVMDTSREAKGALHGGVDVAFIACAVDLYCGRTRPVCLNKVPSADIRISCRIVMAEPRLVTIQNTCHIW